MAPKRRSAAAAADVATSKPADAPPAKKTRRGGQKAVASPAAQTEDAGAAAPAPAAAPAAAADSSDSGAGPSYFLMKSEPDVFSIDDLENKPNQTEHWDGVRSHQAKKVMQSMRVGDQAFFYHSNAKPPGVVGIVEIVREAYPDHTQFERGSENYDPSAKPGSPKWFMVDCRLVRRLQRQISLEELKAHSGGALAGMALFKYGRLSVQPVSQREWEFVLGLERAEPGGKGSHGEGNSGGGGDGT